MIGSVMSKIRKRGGDLVGAYHKTVARARRGAGCLSRRGMDSGSYVFVTFIRNASYRSGGVGGSSNRSVDRGTSWPAVSAVGWRARSGHSQSQRSCSVHNRHWAGSGPGDWRSGQYGLVPPARDRDLSAALLFMFTGYIFAYVALRRHADIARLFGLKNLPASSGRGMVSPKVLDTSAIIDARIGDIVPTLFLRGADPPGFVLENCNP